MIALGIVHAGSLMSLVTHAPLKRPMVTALDVNLKTIQTILNYSGALVCCKSLIANYNDTKR